MAPPPRPPIICYDLQTNTNARRTPSARYRLPVVGANRQTKVTVVHRDQNELDKSRAIPFWSRHENYDDEDNQKYDNPENTRGNQRVLRSSHRSQILKNRESLFSRASSKELVESEPYSIKTRLFESSQPSTAHSNSVDKRFAYGRKLKLENDERENQKKLTNVKTALQTELEKIHAQLESLQAWRESILKSCGIGHNTAKYVQKFDDEYTKLKQGLDQIAEARSRERGRRAQQVKRHHKQLLEEDRIAEEKRLRDMSRLTHCKHKLSSTLNSSLSSNSLTPNTATDTTSSSPTISLSPYSSQTSTDEPTHNLRQEYSFYKYDPQKEETLEVVDEDFFEKVEDKTMIEMFKIAREIKTFVKDFEELQ